MHMDSYYGISLGSENPLEALILHFSWRMLLSHVVARRVVETLR